MASKAKIRPRTMSRIPNPMVIGSSSHRSTAGAACPVWAVIRCPVWLLPNPAARRSVRHVDEAGVMALEGHDDVAHGAVAVLADDDVGLTRARGLALVHVLAVDQHDDVGVLLQAAGLAQV